LGKVDKWALCSERLLAKAKRCIFKDLLLRKLSIPKMDDNIDELTDVGKKNSSFYNRIK
jgi:hypothetical protein